MTKQEAAEIIDRNYDCREKSLIYCLHEKSKFSEKRFWEFYDSAICLAEDAKANGRSADTAMKITRIYQCVLKEFIYHFDKNDLSLLRKFPKNYGDYIERLDYAVDAYFRGSFINDEFFELRK